MRFILLLLVLLSIINVRAEEQKQQEAEAKAKAKYDAEEDKKLQDYNKELADVEAYEAKQAKKDQIAKEKADQEAQEKEQAKKELAAARADKKKQDENKQEKKKITATERNIEKMPKYWTKTESYNQDGHERKVIWINETIYSELIFDASKSKFIAEKPYFIMFVNAKYDSSNFHRKTWIDLASKYDGAVQFAVSNIVLDERLTLTYDITTIMEEGPRAFYIDHTTGQAFYYNNNNYTTEDLSEWIDSKKYESSPYKFKVPPIIGDYKIYWAYAKKDVRALYKEHVQPKIDPLLVKFKVSYLVDMEPEDVVNIKPGQKTDRQILFLIAGITWILETIWDLIFAKETKVVKKKSAISSKKKKSTTEAEEPKEKTSEKKKDKKDKREKIE